MIKLYGIRSGSHVSIDPAQGQGRYGQGIVARFGGRYSVCISYIGGYGRHIRCFILKMPRNYVIVLKLSTASL